MRFVIYDQTVAPTTAGVWKTKAAGTAYTYTIYKTFTIAFNMINQLFDIHNKFYTLAFTKQVV
jgi:hypothetical protein